MLSCDRLGRGANARESLSPGELGRRGYHRSEAGSARRYYVRATLDSRQRLLPGLRYACPARLLRVGDDHGRRIARLLAEALDKIRRAKVDVCAVRRYMRTRFNMMVTTKRYHRSPQLALEARLEMPGGGLGGAKRASSSGLPPTVLEGLAQ